MQEQGTKVDKIYLLEKSQKDKSDCDATSLATHVARGWSARQTNANNAF